MSAETLLLVPDCAIESIGSFLPPADRFRLATLHRLPSLQASSFRGLHRFEFDAAASHNDKSLLELLWRHCNAHNLDPRGTTGAITHCSKKGDLEILRWWRDTAADALQAGARDGVTEASRSGRVDVLDWWQRESGVALRYDEFAMDFASSRGHVAVLQWWKDSGLPARYSPRAIEFACYNGRIESLQWWKDSGLEPKYHRSALERAKAEGRADVLRWWREKSGWAQLPY